MTLSQFLISCPVHGLPLNVKLELQSLYIIGVKTIRQKDRFAALATSDCVEEQLELLNFND